MTLRMNTHQLKRFAFKLGFNFKPNYEWGELQAWPMGRPKQLICVDYQDRLTPQEKRDSIQEMVGTLSFGKDKASVEEALQFAMQKK